MNPTSAYAPSRPLLMAECKLLMASIRNTRDQIKNQNISAGHRILHQKFCVAGQGANSTCAGNEWQDQRGDALLLDRTDLVGIDKPTKKLVGWLVNEGTGREVVSLAGMGGLGKTTLAKQVYDDSEVKKHFSMHAWITVSRSYKMEELLKDIVQQLFSADRKPVPREADNMNSNQLKTIIKELLQNRRYLIVLDDVWHINEWDAVKYALPTNNCGSRVILTTRNADLAFTSRIEYEVSGILATKDMRRIDEWEMVRRSLGAEIEGNDKLKNLKKVLSLSFNDLPYYLKSCFLYLSIFPEDHPIEHMRLIRLWVAEGFVEAKYGKELEDVAGDYLNELLNRSLLQVAETTSDGRIKTCRTHDLLREIVISKSREQNFAVIAKEHNVTWPDRLRRLSIHNTLQNVQQNRLSTYNLKYLSLKSTKVATIPSYIGKLQHLETLDLKHAHVTELPVEILKLRKLRHLLVYRYEYESYAHFHSKHGFKALEKIGVLRSLQKLCLIEANLGNGNIMRNSEANPTEKVRCSKVEKEDGKTLCSSIENLSNLRALSLLSVEDEILDLQHLFSPPPQLLQRLYLTGRLETLPHWIPNLASLVRRI
ncbi:hypothetical protein GH714_014032 [Hevea brasiliensis]|uniref:Uncharacterized protein n=1 Tax=Hevea brasiliensis TaxID=3981 RepID=A0A6A6NH15_HEVBR|nr:hypothetical protein GH714_014032 [Hevea brasiliensis]